MKLVTLLSLLICFTCIGTPLSAVVSPASKETNTSLEEKKSSIEKDWKNLSRKEKRAKRKALKKELKKAKAAGASTNTLLLVIIGLFIPPLAMGLYEGITKRFWISLLLSLLFLLPGIIYTLVVILKES